MTYEIAKKNKANYPDFTTLRGGTMRIFIVPQVLEDFDRYFKDYLTRDFDDGMVQAYSSNGQFKLYYREL
ncbi:hypothetical protein [Flavobacterium sp. DG2-3]|nr:hypothetical protein [Flavobacterium sp. DG2-3]MDP5200316.1 hypothetical protein [Flavobacterium sp. DG2-3]